MIATINWHSNIKKCGYKLSEQLYVVMSAMGAQGFQQNWAGLAVKMASCNSPSVKPATYKLSLRGTPWCLARWLQLSQKHYAPVETYSPCSLHPRFSPLECHLSVLIVATTWLHVLPPLCLRQSWLGLHQMNIPVCGRCFCRTKFSQNTNPLKNFPHVKSLWHGSKLASIYQRYPQQRLLLSV